ncbi:hypothetical protein GW17_00007858 [Ensete ventricosum]|nr:hypothetical protein GW17_00007858 [Ensete ventricosum]
MKYMAIKSERTYEIKDGNLEGKYKDWQKKLHPDLVHSKSEVGGHKEKMFAAEQSARVIDAYRTLSKPLLRAIYLVSLLLTFMRRPFLLKLEDVHVDEEKTITDPDLLAEVEEKFEKWSRFFEQVFKMHDFDNAITATERMRYYDRALEEITKKL